MEARKPDTERARRIVIREHRIPSARQQALYLRRRPRPQSVVLRERRREDRPLRSAQRYASTNSLCRRRTPRRSASARRPTAHLWFAQKTANKIGRITPDGKITEFPLPTPNAGPDGIALGPDGNIWFSETEVSQIGRITPDGNITEFKDGITPGSKPLSIVVRDGALWFSEAAGNRVGRIDSRRRGHRIRHPEQRQPAARHGARTRTARSGSCETGANALGRIDRDGSIQRIQVADAERVACAASRVGPDGDLWFTENFANKIGRMAPGRHA